MTPSSTSNDDSILRTGVIRRAALARLARQSIASIDISPFEELENAAQDDRASAIARSRWLHAYGAFALRSGRIPLSVACLRCAASLIPSKNVYISLGRALLLAGRADDALSAFMHALVGAPDDPDLHVSITRALDRSGRLPEALNVAYRALSLEDSVSTRLQVGLMLQRCGRDPLAIDHYERCLALDGGSVEALLHLGRALLQTRQLERALQTFQRAVSLESRRPELHVGAARALTALGRFREAVDALHAAIAIVPLHVAALQQLVLLSHLAGHRGEGAAAWAMLGEALQVSGRAEEAAHAFRQSLASRPCGLRALINLGDVELLNGRPHAAVEALERALRIDPQHSHAHTSLSKAYHLSGDLRRGLDEFAWRSDPVSIQWRGFEQPLWDGSRLEGKILLVWSNPRSGIGDAIHLYRYCSSVKQQGLRVIVECHPRLVELARTVPGVETVVARGIPLPHFDVHAPTSRLPVVLRSLSWPYTGDIPYVSVDDVLVNEWHERLAAWPSPRIGLVWGGAPDRPDARVRFVPLRVLAPLGRHQDLNLLSMQMGPQAEDLLDLRSSFHVHPALDDTCSLMDTAAAIMNLDLLITVDTMTAHLAGALGARVWTLLAYGADWRWLSGDRTPWYPTMRLWRQTRQGDWSELIERVSSALAEEFLGLRHRDCSTGCFHHGSEPPARV